MDIDKVIDSRTYLLDFQKDALKNDLEGAGTHLSSILDAILYRLIGKGIDSLSGTERQILNGVLKEYGYGRC